MFSLIFPLDGVQETDNIGVRRVVLVPRSEGLESKKEEVADDVLVVMVQLIETCYDIANTELLLSVLEQRDEGALASVRELAGGDAHVERVLPQHRVPVGPDPAQTRSGERDLHCSVWIVVQIARDRSPSIACGVIGFQSITLRVRGIS